MRTRRAILSLTALALAGLLTGSPAEARPAVAVTEAKAAERHAVLLISIDGLMPDAVLNADSHGLGIPTLRAMLAEGGHARVINVNPTVTNPNHTTLVTGVPPREHGIYNNRPFEAAATLPKSYSLYAQIKAPTLWGAAKAAGLKTGSLFWPVTGQAGDIDFNLTDGDDEDDRKIADDAIALIERERPELLTVHFVSLDHRQHETGPLSTEARAALERIDTAIGRVVAAQRKAHPDTVIAIVSDHGFFRVTHQMNLNAALAEGGFIVLNAEKAVASWRAFAWYVGGSAMIVLRDPKDARTKARVKAYLRGLAADPANGIEGIHDGGEIASLGLSPDAAFVVAFRPGYRMGNAMTGPLVKDDTGGAHGAFSTRTLRPDMRSTFLIAGPGIAAVRDLGTIDMRRIAPTLAGELRVDLPSAALPPLRLRDR
ncbi:alkaline phosphatase family protein [Sphingomonas colocasiae]|uniref:Ectonucleotide pyrophosphatase/phosphodiesterase n=1 Tax=Sphingomonas colocasiae TaxID=1848973 RepID=A0ABS7PRW1_9SPHN|nr:ectonucleotide pyrophosphatase/phosphodiesterase [Sphingomonas colocasiae]MBY8823714.1 ectonucleotide pyrophosphatase/phosphodiesterase [Sphingomonas colocasiae]